MGLWDGKYDYSATELLSSCKVEDTDVSIGRALDRLASVVDVGEEYQGGCDGVDALCYHLDAYTCTRAIEALQRVMARFAEHEKM